MPKQTLEGIKMKKLLLVGVLVVCMGIVGYEFYINSMLAYVDILGIIITIAIFKNKLVR